MSNSQHNLLLSAAIAEFSIDAVVGTTLDFTIVNWNENAEKLYGYSSAEIVGQSMLLLVPPERKAEEEILQRKLLMAGAPGHYETERIRKDGQHIYVSVIISPIKNVAGNVIGVSSATRDITNRKRAEAQRELQVAIIQFSDDAIIGKTIDGLITSWNVGAERLYGYTSAEALGKPVAMLMPSDRSDDFPMIMSRIRNGERVEHYETVRQRKDGTRVDVSLTVSPIKDGQGMIIGASAI